MPKNIIDTFIQHTFVLRPYRIVIGYKIGFITGWNWGWGWDIEGEF